MLLHTVFKLKDHNQGSIHFIIYLVSHAFEIIYLTFSTPAHMASPSKIFTKPVSSFFLVINYGLCLFFSNSRFAIVLKKRELQERIVN